MRGSGNTAKTSKRLRGSGIPRLYHPNAISSQPLLPTNFFFDASALHAFDRLVDAWGKIDMVRLNGYVAALPVEWLPARDAAQRVLSYLADLKSHLPETIMEIRKALH